MKTYAVQWRPRANQRLDEFTDYVAQDSSWAYARKLTRRIVREVNKGLRHSPLAYSPAPDWGEGVRRMPVLGRRILFEVDEAARVVRVLTVMGGAENPHDIR